MGGGGKAYLFLVFISLEDTVKALALEAVLEGRPVSVRRARERQAGQPRRAAVAMVGADVFRYRLDISNNVSLVS